MGLIRTLSLATSFLMAVFLCALCQYFTVHFFLSLLRSFLFPCWLFISLLISLFFPFAVSFLLPFSVFVRSCFLSFMHAVRSFACFMCIVLSFLLSLCISCILPFSLRSFFVAFFICLFLSSFLFSFFSFFLSFSLFCFLSFFHSVVLSFFISLLCFCPSFCRSFFLCFCRSFCRSFLLYFVISFVRFAFIFFCRLSLSFAPSRLGQQPKKTTKSRNTDTKKWGAPFACQTSRRICNLSTSAMKVLPEFACNNRGAFLTTCSTTRKAPAAAIATVSTTSALDLNVVLGKPEVATPSAIEFNVWFS